jgi:hypothetical protein
MLNRIHKTNTSKTYARVLPLALLLSMSSLLTACTKKEVALPFDMSITDEVNKALRSRAQMLGITKIDFVCASKTGPLKLDVAYKYGGSQHKKTYKTTTSCSEKGVLVSADVDSYGFSVSTKHNYSPSIVVKEMTAAVNDIFGTLDYNEDTNARLAQLHISELKDMRLVQVDFTCEPKTKVAHYHAFMLDDERKGKTSISCMVSTEKNPVFARVEAKREDKEVSFSILTSKDTTAEQAKLLIEDFVKTAGRRQTF